MRRIYDVAFEPQANQSDHQHLGTFWWLDDTDTSIKGTWTRDEAYYYTLGHKETVYVQEGGDSAWVKPYHYRDDSVRWVQTEADGKLPDNLITLAKRHK